MRSKITDDEIIKALKVCNGNAADAARALGLSERQMRFRRVQLEQVGAPVPSRNQMYRAYERRREATLLNGTVVIFSDAHFWPGELTVAHRALLKVIGDIAPNIVIANGDMLDGPGISAHPPLGWNGAPDLAGEIACVVEHMSGIFDAAKRVRNSVKFFRTIGNHDIRFDRLLAQNAAQFKNLEGFRLADHLPAWPESWSVMINGKVLVKHRWHGGIHATYNNTMKSPGMSMVTGHLHRLMATPWGDHSMGGGRTWGIDTGTLADPRGPQFDYAEDSPVNWGQGFPVLTFHKGKLLPPEFVEVLDGEAFFRAKRVC
jgi:hypothetical protein